MSFEAPRFTDKGKHAFLRAMDGDPLVFTSVKMGDGTLSGQAIAKLEDLIHTTATLSINRITVSDDGYAAVSAVFSNQSLGDGFYWREVGLYCQDQDDPSKEVLYCYQNAGEKANYIAAPGSEVIEKVVKIIAVVDDAQDVRAILNESAVYATTQEVLQMFNEHSANMHAHDQLFAPCIFYVDSSVRPGEVMDGTKNNPFDTIAKAVSAIPPGSRSSQILLRVGKIYDGITVYNKIGLGISSYAGDEDSTTDFPVLPYIKLYDCANVSLRFLHIPGDRVYTEFTNCHGMDVMDCEFSNISMINSVICSGVYGSFIRCSFSGYTQSCIFGKDASVLHLSECTFANAPVGVMASNGGIATVRYCTFSGIETQTSADGTSMVIPNEATQDLMDGTYREHVQYAGNPHNTTIDQILHGSAVSVQHGGTGRTNSGVRLNSYTSNDVRNGSVILGNKLVIAWGKLKTDGESKTVCNVGYLCGVRFLNNQYTVTLSGQDSGWGSIEKETNQFTVNGVSGSNLVADWIAIGIGEQINDWDGGTDV